MVFFLGLVTLDEMKAKREDLVREHEKQLAAQLKSDGYSNNVIHCRCNIEFPWYLTDSVGLKLHFHFLLIFQLCNKLLLFRESKKKKQKKQKTKPSSALSFNVDEEDDNDDLEPGEKNEYIRW